MSGVTFSILLIVALVSGCGSESGEPARESTVVTRAGVVIEPDEIHIGDAVWIEVAVVTPPGHTVKPLPAPESVAGFWVLEAETRPVRREPTRWVHATRFHVRARETGEFEWPTQTAWLETPAGETHELEIEPRPLRVVEVSPEFAERREPFSYRSPAPERRPRGFALPALLGATGALAGLAILVLAGRARARRREAPSDDRTTHGGASWRRAQAALEASLADLERSPIGAADAASAALRIYVTRRYGARAETATTEELSELAPPVGLAKRWPELLRLLRTFDRVRFRPGASDDPLERDELRAALRAAQDFVADSAPPGASP